MYTSFWWINYAIWPLIHSTDGAVSFLISIQLTYLSTFCHRIVVFVWFLLEKYKYISNWNQFGQNRFKLLNGIIVVVFKKKNYATIHSIIKSTFCSMPWISNPTKFKYNWEQQQMQEKTTKNPIHIQCSSVIWWCARLYLPSISSCVRHVYDSRSYRFQPGRKEKRNNHITYSHTSTKTNIILLKGKKKGSFFHYSTFDFQHTFYIYFFFVVQFWTEYRKWNSLERNRHN